ncbi:hypothetical protein CKAN_01218900 [Cinnamomum micranthum f. kanehirae]|uniref:DUF7803 domain-containing protein n=1 Tax=Cinnamomum micranthum f. kanehirae TaxID=337451 RepID=A0A3S3MGV0_9MAGN|nr:hypothetical protein CKAN_01218900 [Cinnamomum micranthum f. kanehirae]
MKKGRDEVGTRERFRRCGVWKRVRASGCPLMLRRMILAGGMEGMEGFRQRWSLHGRLEDTKKRLESLNQGISKRKKEEQGGHPSNKRWLF